MSLEAIYKLQPKHTMSIRGTDGFGAMATVCNATGGAPGTAGAFTVYGVFRDQSDFNVLLIWDADNAYEHYSIKYLPDFNFTGVSLSFDVQYNGLQPFDSARYSWIGWAQIQYIEENGNSGSIYLFDNATLTSGSGTFLPASGHFTFTDPTYGDAVNVIIGDVPFVYQNYTYGVDTKVTVAAFLANIINQHDWSTYYRADVAVVATVDSLGLGELYITYGRTGTVNVSGTAVTWVSGTKFSGLKPGDQFNIGASVSNTGTALQYIVSTVNSPTSVTLTVAYSGAGSTGLSYAAPYGGVDGNQLTIYAILWPNTTYTRTLSVTPAALTLSGGTSYDAVWNVSIDLATYGITSLRQAWFTFAPALADGAAYVDTEWSATFTNWTVSDPSSVTHLQCAGPGSVRVGCYDAWTTFGGSAWDNQDSNNNTYLGRAKSITASDAWVTTEPSSGVFDTSHTLTIPTNSITVKYACNSTHNVYLGTFVYVDRGIITVTLDSGSATTLDCYLDNSEPIPVRRLLYTSVAAGQHVLTISLTGFNATAFNNAQTSTGSGSFPFYYWHDYIEAAVLSDIPSIQQPYPNTAANLPSKLTPALDFDTDQTYKVPPERTCWSLQKMGFTGDLNLYVGVFYWNQRCRGTDANFGSSAVAFSGSVTYGDALSIDVGGTTYTHNVQYYETLETVMNNIIYQMNCGSVGVWGEVAMTSVSAGTLTINVRSTAAQYTYTLTATTTSSTFTVMAPAGSATTPAGSGTGIDSTGVEGTWVVDTTQSNPINYPTRMFLSDMYGLCQANGQQCVTSFSMELVNPPDCSQSPISSPGVWGARFANGDFVYTDTDLSYNDILLTSTQCAPVSALTTFQELVYKTVAGLQHTAGLTPWLQFGEHLWWFFSFVQNSVVTAGVNAGLNLNPLVAQTIGYIEDYASPIYCGVANPHGLSTGDQILIYDVAGCTSANGTWTVSVVDANHFTLNGSTWNAHMTGGGQMYCTSRIILSCSSAHGLHTGDHVVVTGCDMAGAIGTWQITVPTGSTQGLSLNGAAPTLPSASGNIGCFLSGGGMAYYDSETTAAFTAAHSRALATFTCQDDDPTVNSSVDSAFLASRLKAHCDSISAAVLASYSNAKFELLYPDDVNHPTCIYTAAVPYPQGGRMNAAVSFPAAWGVPSTSGLDRIKIECLSWGAQYRSLDLPKAAMSLLTTSPNSWTSANLAYLVAWFNGGCPWENEFLAAVNAQMSLVAFWAFDHLTLQSLNQPMPINRAVGLKRGSS